MIQINLRQLTAGCCLIAACAALWAQAPQRLPRIELHAGMHNISAEVAQTPEERQIGLMYRTTLPGNEGMLFVFEDAQVHCFWMKNTLVPLSIAFLADDGRIVNIEDMAPNTEDSHCPRQKVRYALEMSKGWFGKRGFKSGMALGGPPFEGR